VLSEQPTASSVVGDPGLGAGSGGAAGLVVTPYASGSVASGGGASGSGGGAGSVFLMSVALALARALTDRPLLVVKTNAAGGLAAFALAKCTPAQRIAILGHRTHSGG
jgi:hypothetical protein